jgi:DNA-binding transcriptional regulator YiaG
MTACQKTVNWQPADIFDFSSTGYVDPGQIARVRPRRATDSLSEAIAGCLQFPATGLYLSAPCDVDVSRPGTTTVTGGGDVANIRVYTSNITLGAGQFGASTSPFTDTYIRLTRAVPTIECKSVSEILIGLRAHFSLNTSELARVLGVERPTIYAWSKGTVTVRQQHRARLASLNRLLTFWTGLSPRPLGSLKHLNTGDNTVLDWLTDPSASEDAICEVLRQVAASVSPTVPTIRSIAEIARERGWTKRPTEKTEQTLRSVRRRSTT